MRSWSCCTYFQLLFSLLSPENNSFLTGSEIERIFLVRKPEEQRPFLKQSGSNVCLLNFCPFDFVVLDQNHILLGLTLKVASIIFIELWISNCELHYSKPFFGIFNSAFFQEKYQSVGLNLQIVNIYLFCEVVAKWAFRFIFWNPYEILSTGGGKFPC